MEEIFAEEKNALLTRNAINSSRGGGDWPSTGARSP